MTTEHRTTTEGARMSCTCGRSHEALTNRAAKKVAKAHAEDPVAASLIVLDAGEWFIFSTHMTGFLASADSEASARRIAPKE